MAEMAGQNVRIQKWRVSLSIQSDALLIRLFHEFIFPWKHVLTGQAYSRRRKKTGQKAGVDTASYLQISFLSHVWKLKSSYDLALDWFSRLVALCEIL
jgi:hypothetical protein